MFLFKIARAGIRLNCIGVNLTKWYPKCNSNLAAPSLLRSVKHYSTPIHEIKSNVANDVILYKYENPRFYKIINWFAVIQYGVWAYIASFAFTSLRDTPIDPDTIDENTPFLFRYNLGDKKFKYGLGVFSLFIGVTTLCIVWTLTLRSVRYLVLHKGGKYITFVTYTPMGKNRMMKVPIQDISCKESRTAARVQIPIKVRNRWLHYILDVKGEFKNGPLFDCTAGVFRKFL